MANEDGVVQLAEDKYAQPTVTGTDLIFTVLAEFGAQGSGKLGTDRVERTAYGE